MRGVLYLNIVMAGMTGLCSQYSVSVGLQKVV